MIESKVLGIDLGGSNVRAVVLGPRGATPFSASCWKLKNCFSAPTELQHALRNIRRFVSSNPRSLAAAGIATAPRLHRSEGTIESWPTRPWWRGVDLRSTFEDALGMPTVFEDDANSAALAEWEALEQEKRPVVFATIAVGTGLGCGLVLAGKIFSGAFGQAGDLGHLLYHSSGAVCGCGAKGCLQTVGSGAGILRLAHEYHVIFRNNCPLPRALRSPARWTAESLAKHGSELNWVRRAFEEAARAVAWGCYQVWKLFDPEQIVITGGVTQSKFFCQALYRDAADLGMGQLLVRSRRNTFAASTGAALLARRTFLGAT